MSSRLQLLEWKHSVDDFMESSDRRYDSLNSHVQELERACAGKAESADVHRVFVKRDDFGEVIRAMGTDVDSRAAQRDLHSALQRIEV